jgi:hypothetical protein
MCDDMPANDLRIWAQEEMAEAVIQHSAELLGKIDTTFDERAAIKKQRDRVIKFLNQTHNPNYRL